MISPFIGMCHYKHNSKFQYITPTLKKLHWFPNKELITNCLLTYKTLTNQKPTFIFIFHFRHILFLQDLLIHSFFPFHMSDHHLAKGLHLSMVHDSVIPSLLIPETHLLYQYSVRSSKHTSSNLLFLARLLPAPLTFYPDFDSCYSYT